MPKLGEHTTSKRALTFDIDEETRAALQAFCERERVGQATVIRRAIRAYVEPPK